MTAILLVMDALANIVIVMVPLKAARAKADREKDLYNTILLGVALA